MSVELIGNAKFSSEIREYGKPGKYGNVDVGIKSLVNRETKAQQIKKLLKDGFDWKKFTPPLIAVFPDGREMLLDGDHRRAMFRTAFPNRTKMPCFRIKIACEKEYHRLFSDINWKSRKTATKDEVFVHDVLAETPAALRIQASLLHCNLSVYGSPDEFGTVGAHNSKRVTVGSFKKSLRRGIENVKSAADLLSQAWPEADKIQGELLEAVSILFEVHPSFRNGSKIEEDFKKWFKNYVAMRTQYNAASDYKTKGGRVHHKHGESMAHGLIMDYRRSCVPGGCSVKHKQKFVRLKNTADLLE
tara:strand:- start:1036 stop:1941 length:906 start_codon:yes stop_codon:yes gene_type:complete